MNKKIIYVSYYTLNTPYEKEINIYLKPSLDKFKLNYDIQGIPDLGSWRANTNYKNTFILKMLEKHKKPLVFLDADAEILKNPILFNKIDDSYDLGVHFLDWYKCWRKQKGNLKREMLSGTLYIPYKRKTIQLIQQFIKEIKKNSDIWEQRSMQKIVELRKKDLFLYYLPYSYITFPLQNGELPKHMVNPSDIVILHHQASRKYKNRNNWNKYE